MLSKSDADSPLLPLSLNSKTPYLHGTMWTLYVNYGATNIHSCFSLAHDGGRHVARACLLSAMKDGVKTGSLVVVEGDSVYTFGEPTTPKQPAVIVRVVNANFWCRVYASHDLGCKSSLVPPNVRVSMLTFIYQSPRLTCMVISWPLRPMSKRFWT